MIRTVLVDDHPLFTAGLRRLMKDQLDFDIVATFTSGITFLEAFKDLEVDLVIIDIELPGLDGLQIIQRLRQHNHVVKVVVLSMHEEEIFRAAARKSGANGYFSKSDDSHSFVEWVRALMQGDGPANFQAASKKTREPQVLSGQEFAILRLIAKGRTSQEIGEAINISPLTVKTHRKNMMRKLNAPNSAGLIRIAYDKGLI